MDALATDPAGEPQKDPQPPLCTRCGNPSCHVLRTTRIPSKSRSTGELTSIIRRERECDFCGRRFTTTERENEDPPVSAAS